MPLSSASLSQSAWLLADAGDGGIDIGTSSPQFATCSSSLSVASATSGVAAGLEYCLGQGTLFPLLLPLPEPRFMCCQLPSLSLSTPRVPSPSLSGVLQGPMVTSYLVSPTIDPTGIVCLTLSLLPVLKKPPRMAEAWLQRGLLHLSDNQLQRLGTVYKTTTQQHLVGSCTTVRYFLLCLERS